nr:TIGR03862 family flavoprotein [uncultured Cohaesibacter sp.]
MQEKNKKVAIIGAGAAGLMAADRLSALRPELSIHLFDAMPSPARKILMAGKSGLNISHRSGLANPEAFAKHYSKAADWMRPMLEAFGTKAILDWMDALGQEHFVGSTGRIFPKAMKASPLLRALMKRLEERGVTLASRHRWIGWNQSGALLFQTNHGEQSFDADACLLALGGPSWPRLGTDGAFLAPLAAHGIESAPFRPSNCGFDVDLVESFGKEWAGTPVKSVRLSFAGRSVSGDFVISNRATTAMVNTGAPESGTCSIEGGPVYALSAAMRDALETDGSAILSVDLRPNLTQSQVKERLARPRGKQSLSNHLRRTLKLQGIQAALLKALTDKSVMNDPDRLSSAIKGLPLKITATRPIAEAISTAGGIGLDEVDESLMVKRSPGLFIAGEMLDWEAPTGGYLLTGCLSQGYRAAEGIAHYLDSDL